MSVAEGIIGPMAVGSWVNYCLFTLELVQTIKYFWTYHDHWLLQIGVVLALLSDTAATISASIGVYNITIRHFGDSRVFLKVGAEIPTYVITGAFSALICHMYLTWRFYRLSRNVWASGFLALLSFASMASACYTGYSLIRFSTYAGADRDHHKIAILMWFSFEVASDLFIALLLVLYLFKHFKDAQRKTQSMLFRIILITIESGSATAAFIISAVVSYIAAGPNSNATVAFGFCMGRIYTLNLLLNLNIRKSGLLPTGSTNYRSTRSTKWTISNPKPRVFTVTVKDGDTGMQAGPNVPESIAMVPGAWGAEARLKVNDGMQVYKE